MRAPKAAFDFCYFARQSKGTVRSEAAAVCIESSLMGGNAAMFFLVLFCMSSGLLFVVSSNRIVLLHLLVLSGR